ncbi:unnamed protein product [Moneuplotes crassus]|uniref:Uncharacterized protein n=2 Tax=Euplotes crassus TaxID=5936 RepID=A0AAD1Y6H9_EUPCR|nr:unnamed protein product [Moneuplotes crassus]
MSWSLTKYYNIFYQGVRPKITVGSCSAPQDDHKKVVADNLLVCRCSVCCIKKSNINAKEKKKILEELNKIKDYIDKNTEKKEFHWLAQHLTSPNNTLKGCEINIPEYVFFNNGKPEFVLKKDKDGFLNVITQEDKLQFYKIRRTLHNVIRARKRGLTVEELGENSKLDILSKDPSFEVDHKMANLNLDSSPKKSSSKMSEFGFSPKSILKASSEPPELNKDSAIIRFLDGKTKIVGDVELAEKFSQSSNINYWKTVRSINTLVKSKIGIGTPIFINYIIPYEKLGSEINYDFREFDDEIDYKKHPNYGLPLDKYCLKQCLKICYYLQKIFLYEIIKMDCAFAMGENEVCLYYVSDIHIREMKEAQPFWMKEKSESKYLDTYHHIEGENRDFIDMYYQKEPQDLYPKNGKEVTPYEALKAVMYKEFEVIKESNGIDDIVNYPFFCQEDEKDNDEALKELRPGRKHKVMRDFLVKNKDFRRFKKRGKTAHNRRKKSNCKKVPQKKAQNQLLQINSFQNCSNIYEQMISDQNSIRCSNRSIYNPEYLKKIHSNYQKKRVGPFELRKLSALLKKQQHHTTADFKKELLSQSSARSLERRLVNTSNRSIGRSRRIHQEASSYSRFLHNFTDLSSQRGKDQQTTNNLKILVGKMSAPRSGPSRNRVHRLRETDNIRTRHDSTQGCQEKYINITEFRSDFHKKMFKSKQVSIKEARAGKILTTHSSADYTYI